jgi:hypothetical protein
VQQIRKDLMVTNPIPEEKRLQHASFVVHATRGVIRDQKTRRRMMVVVLTLAAILMVAGTTFLRTPLDPHVRPGWFLCFWLVCAWFTVTAILLAIFDVLTVMAKARNAQRNLRRGMAQQSSAESADR